jgi:glycosyltransferase involved in cell wall biosynthesis
MISSSYPRHSHDYAGVFVRSLAEHLAACGHQIDVLAAEDGEVIPSDSSSQVKVHHFPYAWPKSLQLVGYGKTLHSDVKLRKSALAVAPSYFISGFIHLLALVKRNKADVIHAHWAVPTAPIGAIVARITQTPLVISVHGSDVYLLEKNTYVRNLAVRSLKAARTVTACSDDLRERVILAGVPDQKVVTIPYGVDTGLFSDSPINDTNTLSLRTELGIELDALIIMGLGRLVKKKGFEYLLRAIPIVKEKVPAARFVIAGDGDEKPELLRLARELDVYDSTKFPGAIAWHSVPSYLALCDIFVVPSIKDDKGNVDGLPNVLLEAMSCGKPIVGTNVAGLPSAIRDGIDGYLVNEKSPDELARAIIDILSSSQARKKMGENARQRVEDSFRWEAVAERMTEVYEAAVRT